MYWRRVKFNFWFLNIHSFILLVVLVSNLHYFCLWISISCSRASDYGLMKIDDTGRVVQFAEKPKGADLKAMVINFILHCCLMSIYSKPSSRNLQFSKILPGLLSQLVSIACT